MLHDYSPAKLKSLRKRSLLTQVQVAQLTGVCEATIYNVENGIRRPQTRTLDKLLNLYAIRMQQIKNLNTLFEDNHNGGNLSSQATIRTGSTGIPPVRAAQKT